MAAALLAMFHAYPMAPPSPAPEAKPEYEVKAAFLFNFTKFVEWPPTAFENPESPFVICILGDDRFGPVLDHLVDGEFVGNRKVTVRRIRSAPKAGGCQLLFVAGNGKATAEVLASIGPGVLTVGEGDDFLQEGGIIAFVIDGGHVRFDINQRAAASASLSLNARLLNVARSVRK